MPFPGQAASRRKKRGSRRPQAVVHERVEAKKESAITVADANNIPPKFFPSLSEFTARRASSTGAAALSAFAQGDESCAGQGGAAGPPTPASRRGRPNSSYRSDGIGPLPLVAEGLASKANSFADPTVGGRAARRNELSARVRTRALPNNRHLPPRSARACPFSMIANEKFPY